MGNNKHMTHQIHLDRHFPVPIARLWEAWIDPKQAGVWFAARARIVPERGGPYELFWRPETPESDSTIGCRITAIKTLQYLAFTWRGPDVHGATMNEGEPPPPPTHVSIAFKDSPDGSRLSVSHSGFGSGEGWEAARLWHDGAWQRCLDNLEAFLGHRPLPFPWNALQAMP